MTKLNLSNFLAISQDQCIHRFNDVSLRSSVHSSDLITLPFPPIFSVFFALGFVKLLLFFIVPHGKTEHLQIEPCPCSTAASRK